MASWEDKEKDMKRVTEIATENVKANKKAAAENRKTKKTNATWWSSVLHHCPKRREGGCVNRGGICKTHERFCPICEVRKCLKEQDGCQSCEDMLRAEIQRLLAEEREARQKENRARVAAQEMKLQKEKNQAGKKKPKWSRQQKDERKNQLVKDHEG